MLKIIIIKRKERKKKEKKGWATQIVKEKNHSYLGPTTDLPNRPANHPSDEMRTEKETISPAPQPEKKTRNWTEKTPSQVKPMSFQCAEKCAELQRVNNIAHQGYKWLEVS